MVVITHCFGHLITIGETETLKALVGENEDSDTFYAIQAGAFKHTTGTYVPRRH